MQQLDLGNCRSLTGKAKGWVASEDHPLHLKFCEYTLSISNPPSHALHAFVCAGTLSVSERAKVKTYRGPPSEETAAAEAVAGGGEDGKEEEGGAEEKEATAVAAGRGGGSRPRKTLPRMDPEEALRAFAESVGMSVDAMWRGVKRGRGGRLWRLIGAWNA